MWTLLWMLLGEFSGSLPSVECPGCSQTRNRGLAKLTYSHALLYKSLSSKGEWITLQPVSQDNKCHKKILRFCFVLLKNRGNSASVTVEEASTSLNVLQITVICRQSTKPNCLRDRTVSRCGQSGEDWSLETRICPTFGLGLGCGSCCMEWS